METDDKRQGSNLPLVLIAMIVGLLIGLMTAKTISRRTPPTLESKIGEVSNLIDNEYVDQMDIDSVSERLLTAMLTELDPHSSYFSARDTRRNEELMRGSFEGVGIVLHYEDDSCYVGNVMAGGPSDGTGIHAGDKILMVDADTISGKKMPNDSVVARLRGPRGSQVRVQLERLTPRAGSWSHDTLSFVIRRGVVEHHTVNCATMLDNTTAYIQLSSFSATSPDEFRAALRKLKAQGMQRLVFDLRSNPGGSLQSAVEIAGELLPKGSPIVYIQGAHTHRKDLVARSNGLFASGPLTVLVDENSASASEVVSGALQDNDRALIAGRRTFGKGLVQSAFDLSDGSSVLLTTARYYTPSGRCIQRPYTKGTEEYYREYLEHLVDEVYADSALAHPTDTTPYYTLAGRLVHGGGGITPDKLLPYRKDSSFIYYNALSGKGAMRRVAFEQVRRHGAEWLRRYRDAESFGHQFLVGDAMVEAAAADGERSGVARNPKSLAAQRHLIASVLKANIGFALFGNEAYYAAILQTDDDLAKVKNLTL